MLWAMRHAPALLAALALLALLTFAYTKGRDDHATETQKQDQEAQDAADNASSVFGRCMDDGGVFDFATGKCRGR